MAEGIRSRLRNATRSSGSAPKFEVEQPETPKNDLAENSEEEEEDDEEGEGGVDEEGEDDDGEEDDGEGGEDEAEAADEGEDEAEAGEEGEDEVEDDEDDEEEDDGGVAAAMEELGEVREEVQEKVQIKLPEIIDEGAKENVYQIVNDPASDNQENQSDAMSTTSSTGAPNASVSPSHSGEPLTPRKQKDQLSNFKTQTELRRQYSELIETCQDYREKDGIEKSLKDMMSRNMRIGSQLFDKIGGGPGDMYMAFLHTKMCSGMILSKTEKIGASASGFVLEQFFASLIEKAHGDMGDYSPLVASRIIAQEANKSQKTLPALVAILGAFDRSSVLTPGVKEKKQKTPRRKQFDENEEATHHEEVKLSEGQRAQKDKDSPEARSQEILRILNACCKGKKKPATNLVEFTMHRLSLPQFFENLFYVSFLVRDGYVSIKRKKRKNDDRQIFDSDLLIAPEVPPKKNVEQEDSVRSQHILSFNARTFQALARASQGKPLIDCPRRHRQFKIAQSPI